VLYHYKILLSISHLLAPPQQFVPELSICTNIIHDFCVPFSTLMIQYSQHFFYFSYLALGSSPISHSHPSYPQTGSGETWNGSQRVSAWAPQELCLPIILQQTWTENWGLCPFYEGERAGSPSNTMWSGPRHLNPFSRLATIHGPKIGRGLLCPLLRGCGFPCNTMSPGPRPTSLPSGILFHPAVWPQQTWAENWGLCPFWRGIWVLI